MLLFTQPSRKARVKSREVSGKAKTNPLDCDSSQVISYLSLEARERWEQVKTAYNEGDDEKAVWKEKRHLLPSHLSQRTSL